MQPQAAKLNPAVGQFLIRQLAGFQSVSWPTLHLEAENIKDECNARENINTRKVFTSLDTGQISGILATQQDSASKRKLTKRNPAVGQFSIRQLANFQSGSWPIFNPAVGRHCILKPNISRIFLMSIVLLLRLVWNQIEMYVKNECNARENINTRKVFTMLDTGQTGGILVV